MHDTGVAESITDNEVVWPQKMADNRFIRHIAADKNQASFRIRQPRKFGFQFPVNGTLAGNDAAG